jgi:hypothetical protein
MFLLCILLTSFIHSIKAYPTYAGTCDAGNFGLGQTEHRGSRQTLAQRNLMVQVDGTKVNPGTIFELSQGSHDFTLTNTDGSRTFKGFLFRLEGANGIDASNMLSENTSLARMNGMCRSKISGIEHTSKTSKNSITTTFFSREIGDYVMDLHVVVSGKSDWVYDQFQFKVVDIGVPTTSPAPTSVKTIGVEQSSTTMDKKTIGLVIASSIVGAYFVLMALIFAFKAMTKEKPTKTVVAVPEEQSSWVDVQVSPKSNK